MPDFFEIMIESCRKFRVRSEPDTIAVSNLKLKMNHVEIWQPSREPLGILYWKVFYTGRYKLQIYKASFYFVVLKCQHEQAGKKGHRS